jgi:hypothetical protein
MRIHRAAALIQAQMRGYLVRVCVFPHVCAHMSSWCVLHEREQKLVQREKELEMMWKLLHEQSNNQQTHSSHAHTRRPNQTHEQVHNNSLNSIQSTNTNDDGSALEASVPTVVGENNNSNTQGFVIPADKPDYLNDSRGIFGVLNFDEPTLIHSPTNPEFANSNTFTAHLHTQAMPLPHQQQASLSTIIPQLDDADTSALLGLNIDEEADLLHAIENIDEGDLLHAFDDIDGGNDEDGNSGYINSSPSDVLLHAGAGDEDGGDGEVDPDIEAELMHMHANDDPHEQEHGDEAQVNYAEANEAEPAQQEEGSNKDAAEDDIDVLRAVLLQDGHIVNKYDETDHILVNSQPTFGAGTGRPPIPLKHTNTLASGTEEEEATWNQLVHSVMNNEDTDSQVSGGNNSSHNSNNLFMDSLDRSEVKFSPEVEELAEVFIQDHLSRHTSVRMGSGNW